MNFWECLLTRARQEGYCGMVEGLAMKAKQLVDDFAALDNTNTSRQLLHSAGTWQAPPTGFMKVNVDASFDIHNRRAGLGVIARNSSGSVIFSAAQKIGNISVHLYAEFSAISLGLAVCLE
ncbi:hypothetical protein REPUB_Repub20aG0062700 [Reevesia pubescens]